MLAWLLLTTTCLSFITVGYVSSQCPTCPTSCGVPRDPRRSHASPNLAFNKSAIQNSTYKEKADYRAYKAVNNATDDFSHTALEANSWWRVDLGRKYVIGQIELYNRENYYCRLAKISIFTSNFISPDTPSNSSRYWTFRHYQEEHYGAVGTVTFNSPTEARHVAVYSMHTDGLTLVEVKIYRYNYALHMYANHSGNSSYPASKAVDGSISNGNFSTTSVPADNSNHWWKVKLSHPIVFNSAHIYVRNSSCGEGPCADRLGNVSFLTSNTTTHVLPNIDGTGSWSSCNYSDVARGVDYEVKCDGGRRPVTKEFSIRTNGGKGVGLREVEIYGSELPQLDGDGDWRVESATMISLTVSFNTWNDTWTGSVGPTRYLVKSNGVQRNITIEASSRASVMFDGLTVKQNYTFTVSCFFHELPCRGPKLSFSASTVCENPSSPRNLNITPCAKGRQGGWQKWNCTLSWQAPAAVNCPGNVTYNLIGNFAGETSARSSQIYLNGNQQYNIGVRAVNSDGNYSIYANVSGTTNELAPQFGLNQFNATALNSSCITLNWSQPLYPGGNIRSYEVTCSGETAQTVGNTTHRMLSCDHQPNTPVTCHLKAYNSLPEGSENETATATTLCDVPSVPRNLSLTSTRCEEKGIKKWKYTARWQAPEHPNCGGPLQYVYGVHGNVSSALLSNTSVIFYLNGSQSYNFIVRAHNSKGYSTESAEDGTSRKIEPQFGSSQFTLMAASSRCVNLSWTEPQYPGGPITHYQIRCAEGGWQNVSHTQRTNQSCGHLPNTLVTCHLKAFNEVPGGSQEQTTPVITDCDVPEKSHDLSLVSSSEPVLHDGRLMWRYTAEWQEPRKNCNGTLNYNYSSPGHVIDRPQTKRNATFYVDGNETFTFAVSAGNTIGYSEQLTQDETSPPIVPQFGSVSLLVEGHNFSCVSLNWNAPRYPGGNINGYHVQCQNRTWTQEQTLSRLSCGYQPYSEVRCHVMAFNSKGNSTAIDGTGKTNCTVPGTPANITMEYNNVTHSGRKMWECTATWQEPRKNCDGQLTYIYQVEGATANSSGSVTNAKFYLDGYQNFTVIVKANGIEGYSPPGSKSDQSPQLAPQFKPTNVTLVATSPYNVSLSWTPPLYPGGPITHYLCNCSDQHKRVDSNKNRVQFGGFKPYTNITCTAQACNRIGESEVEEKTTITHCAKPEFLSHPSVNESYDGPRQRRMAIVHVANESVEVNCRYLKPVQYKVLDRSFSTNNTITGLNATTTYGATVVIENSASQTAEIQVNFTTGELAPWSGPVIGGSKSENRSCAVFNWTEPDQPNGVIVGYRFRCTNERKDQADWNHTTSTSLSDCGYEAGEIVTCEIQAKTAIGFGPSSSTMVNITCDKPSGPKYKVRSLREKDATATLIIELQESHSFCQSLRYVMTIRSHNDTIKLIKNETSHGEYRFPNLDGFTNYTVTVDVINNDNLNRSSSKKITTVETIVPEKPAQLTLKTTKDCGLLTVTEPLTPNGIITKYTFTCESQDNTKVHRNATKMNHYVKFCGFNSATKINCTVGAHNTVGLGQLTTETAYTQINIVKMEESMPVIYTPPENSETVPITLKTVSLGNKDIKISFYYILLEKLSSKSRDKRSADNLCFKIPRSSNALEDEKLNETCYTTAKLPAEKVTDGYKFEVGDGKFYGGYHNKKLESNEKYDLHTAVTADVPAADPLVQFLPPVSFTAPPKPSHGDATSEAAIGGGVTTGLLLVTAIVVVIVFIRRRKKMEESKENLKEDRNGIELRPEPQTPTVMKKRAPMPLPQEIEDDDEVEADIYDNAGITTSEPIPIDKLFWYNKTNEDAIKAQYDDLQKLPAPVTKHALRLENKGKCRYRNLYPSDKHRVKLVRENHEDTDFINASFIAGYKRDNQYIAVQGPFTEAVTTDFWLMVWQQRPSAIVMVTRTVENTKMKCLQYWPIGEGIVLTFGDFKISRTSSDMFSDFSVSTLMVSKNGEKRMIPHFNYLTWPDHGVPDIEVFVAFHRMISASIHQNKAQPLLVHCSAGVGRTGTYIALDYLLDQAKKENMVDAFCCVAEMRRRRPSMIQTVDQYVLLHHALYESFSTQTVSCPPQELRTRLGNHEKHHNTDLDLISSEYKHVLERIQSLTFTYEAGKAVENQDKNRFSEILPCDNYMLYLSNGANGSYINAVVIDGYRKKKQWISTQIPLSHTIIDFWQLMLEQDVEIVVQLEGSQKPFYPLQDAKKLTIDPFIIERKTSVDGDAVKTITICVKKNQEERQVQVLVVKNWLKETLPTTDVIISTHQATERLQQQCGESKICVTCLDGSSRCGLYICSHNAIEKMKAEQEVNVYYPTVMAKLRRPQFIPTLEQYNFLYQVMENYMSAFGEYANFG